MSINISVHRLTPDDITSQIGYGDEGKQSHLQIGDVTIYLQSVSLTLAESLDLIQRLRASVAEHESHLLEQRAATPLEGTSPAVCGLCSQRTTVTDRRLDEHKGSTGDYCPMSSSTLSHVAADKYIAAAQPVSAVA